MEARNLMALNWDITEVQNTPVKEEGLSEDEQNARWSKLEHIIFSCLGTGIGHIKDETEAREWFNRYQVYSIHSGYDNYVTLDDVMAYIGLRTNVSRESRFQWDARMRKLYKLK